MKLYITILLLLISTIGFSQSTDLSILEKSVEKMNALKYFSISEKQFFINSFTDEKTNSSFKLYFDTTSKDSLLGCKYVKKRKDKLGKEITSIFNGKDYFTVNEKDQVILSANKFEKVIVNNSIAFSIPALKKLIPNILNNPQHIITHEKDTIINDINSYRFNITVINGWVQGSYIKKLDETANKTMQCRLDIFLNKETLLPTSYISYSTSNYNEHEVNIITHFENLELTKPLTDSELSIHQFPDHYKKYSLEEYYTKNLYKFDNLLNNNMDGWSLTSIENKEVSQNDLKGKFTLIEFMFVGCGYCVQAIPELNTLQETYKNQLEVLSIDFQNSKLETLKKYHLKTNAKFQTLSGGKDLADKYGINMGPTFLLLDKDSKVVWLQRGLVEGGIIKEVKKFL